MVDPYPNPPNPRAATVQTRMDRTYTTRSRMQGGAGDGYVPGTPAERIALVWPLTREVASLSKRYDAERRLQRHVASVGRREG